MNFLAIHAHCLRPTVFAGVIALASATAQAQRLPDAGQVLRQQQQVVPEPPNPQAVSVLPVPTLQGLVEPGGAAFEVAVLQFVGNTALSSEALLALIPTDEWQRKMDLSQLQALADRFSQVYREAGYPFAQVLVPAQNLSQGTLILAVVEGRFGKVEMQGDPGLVQRLQPFLGGLVPGALIASAPLERATLLLADLPGLSSDPVMLPGEEHGTGDLLFDVKQVPGQTWRATMDNHGSRYLGHARAQIHGQWDSPLTVGDQLTVQGLLSSSQAMGLAALNYSLPLGAPGTKLLVGASHTAYELGKDLAHLGGQGTAVQWSTGISQAWVRSKNLNLTGSLQWQNKRLHDQQTGTGSHKTSQVMPFGVTFDVRDRLGQGAITYGALTWTLGTLQIDASSRTQDAASARSEGGFGKRNLEVARLQTLGGGWQFFVRGTAQRALTRNLDSSEGFGAGGPTAVRAYPAGEAYGDSGWVTQWELRRQIGAWEPFAFYDQARVTINQKPWNQDPNQRMLAGSGLGLRHQQGPWSTEASLAWRTQGGAPTSDTFSTQQPRAWVSVGYRFF